MFLRKKYDYDLIVIGTGAGSSVGAHYAAEIGKQVAIFEKGAIGGECPNFACVPTKALLHAAHLYNEAKNGERFGLSFSNLKLNFEKVHSWKNLTVARTGASHGEESLRHDNLKLVRKKAKFISPHEVVAGGKKFSASKFLIATGSKATIPGVAGLRDTGFLTSKEAINLDKLPESIFILGGGAVACELGQAFNLFGSQVTISIRSDKLLSKEDAETQDLVGGLFENSGVKLLPKSTVTKIEKKEGKKVVHYRIGREKHTITVDEIIIAIGKTSVLDFDPEKAGIKISEKRIKANSEMRTNVNHIYIAGDIAGPYLFTHTGYYQSYVAVHNAFSRKKHRANYEIVPRCVFLDPEVASVGISEREAVEKGIKIKKGIAPIAILGRANTENQFDGFVKLITDPKERIIGGSIVAPRAGEMIHQIALAIKMNAKASDLSTMIVAYPTFSECIKLAASSLE